MFDPTAGAALVRPQPFAAVTHGRDMPAAATVVLRDRLSTAHHVVRCSAPQSRAEAGVPVMIRAGRLPEDSSELASWRVGGGNWCAFDFDGSGRPGIVVAEMMTDNELSPNPDAGRPIEEVGDRPRANTS